MRVAFNGNINKLLRDVAKEKERIDPYNIRGPDWAYLLDPSQPDPLARLHQFLAIDGVSLYVSGRRDSKLGRYLGLHAAVKLNNQAAILLLLEKGASVHSQVDGSAAKEEVTALHVAAESGHTEAADILLVRGANIEARDFYSNTPLHSAIRCLKLDMVKYLLSKGANVTARTRRGQSVLDTAVATGRAQAVQLLIDLITTDKASFGMLVGLQSGEEGTTLEHACSLRVIAPFWTLVLNGIDQFSQDQPSTFGWGQSPVIVTEGKLPAWLETSIGWKLASHPILIFLEQLLWEATFPKAPHNLVHRDFCHNCTLLATNDPIKYQLRTDRVYKWKHQDTTFNYGYFKRCELCRTDLMDHTEWLEGTLNEPMAGTSTDGRWYGVEDDYLCLIRANASLDHTTTGTPAMINLAAYWMLRCIKSHTECGSGRAPVRLPRYLVDTGLLNASTDPFLHESAPSEIGYYFTLSYRWGTNPLTTTQQNLANFKKRIPKSTLPGIIRDAIEVTKQLGCQYIWIDALCIVQDDYRHKEAEINSMGEIYQNSTLTIAAALDRSSAQQDGLFRKWVENKVGLHDVSRKPDNLLDGRGWILQEQVLCSRTLTFSANEVYWTCNGVDASASNPSGNKIVVTPQNQGQQSKLQRDITYRNVNKYLNGIKLPEAWHSNIYDLWLILVTDYSHRDLSVDNDRLAALSGVGSRLENVLSDQLIAGHWRSQLVNSLAWSVNTGPTTGLFGQKEKRSYPFSDVQILQRRRPDDLKLPTWSWASVHGPISYGSSFYPTHPETTAKYVNGSNRSTTVVNITVNRLLSSRDIEGRLTLRGSFMTARASIELTSSTALGMPFSEGGTRPMLFSESFCDGGCGEHVSPTSHGTVSCQWFPDITADGITEVHCFHIVDLFCICLTPTGKKPDEYVRVGACDWKLSERGPSFDEVECPDIVSGRLEYIRNQPYGGFGEWSEAGYLKERKRPRSKLETVTIV